MNLDLDSAIAETYETFALHASDIILQPLPGRTFCRMVEKLHGAKVAAEVILTRLLDLEMRGMLPNIIVFNG